MGLVSEDFQKQEMSSYLGLLTSGLALCKQKHKHRSLLSPHGVFKLLDAVNILTLRGVSFGVLQ
jgi:hypothetical protein